LQFFGHFRQRSLCRSALIARGLQRALHVAKVVQRFELVHEIGLASLFLGFGGTQAHKVVFFEFGHLALRLALLLVHVHHAQPRAELLGPFGKLFLHHFHHARLGSPLLEPLLAPLALGRLALVLVEEHARRPRRSVHFVDIFDPFLPLLLCAILARLFLSSSSRRQHLRRIRAQHCRVIHHRLDAQRRHF
jgi:hypothetical protein